jgi:hypothetical protein
MSDPKLFDKKILSLIVLDLAEIPIKGRSSHRPGLKDSDLTRLEGYIKVVTGETITSKTLNKYRKETGGGARRSAQDFVAAAWLVAMNVVEKDKFRANAEGAFEECKAVFKQRKALISEYIGLEGDEGNEGLYLEYKEDLTEGPKIADGKRLGDHLSAFANTSGGLVLVGVGESLGIHYSTKLTGEEPFIHKTLATLERLTPKDLVSQLDIQFGWAYFLNGLFSMEPESFFFIQVPVRSSQDVPIRASGVAYKRIRSKSVPVDEGGPNELSTTCSATEARAKLLKNLKKVISLITASKVLPGPEIGTVCILSLFYTAATFAKYLTDIFGEISEKLNAHAHTLEVDKELRSRMIEKLKSAKIEELLADRLLVSEPVILRLLAREQHTISRVFQLARVWEQRVGIEDRDFLSFAGSGQIEEKITPNMIRSLARNLNKISRAIDSEAISRHELKAQETEDLTF